MNQGSGLYRAVASGGETGEVTGGRGHGPTPGTSVVVVTEGGGALLARIRFTSGGAVLFCPCLRFSECCVKLEAGGEVAGGTSDALIMLMCDGGGGSGADRVA